MEQTEVIDVIARSDDGRCILVMTEMRPWVDGSEQLMELQSKVNTYIACVESGAVREVIPDADPAHITFQLDTLYPPEGMGAQLVEQLAGFVHENLGIQLVVNVLPEEYRLLVESGMPEQEVVALVQSGKPFDELRAIADSYSPPPKRGLFGRKR